MNLQTPDPFSRDPTPWHWWGRLLTLFITIIALAACAFISYSWWVGSRGESFIAVGDLSLNPADRIYLQTYLSNKQDALNSAAGLGVDEVKFTIEPGQTAEQIADNLIKVGLLQDAELFRNYTRFYGFDDQLEAGTFTLVPTMTVAEIAQALTQSVSDDVILRFVEGWRIGEMADYLRQNPAAQIDADQFLAITERRVAFDLSGYSFAGTLPPTATLEGYLFPDTYRLEKNAATTELLHKMLANFDTRLTPAMRQQFGAQGLGIHQAVNLAAIVEREAVVESERPQIAQVFLNRLASDTKLDADPTIQYALGQQADGSWWKSPLWQEDLVLDSFYNTYLYPGLPPGPIANPGLASLQAVAQPAGITSLFFVADCNANAPGTHLFSNTYEEHLANVEKCR